MFLRTIPTQNIPKNRLQIFCWNKIVYLLPDISIFYKICHLKINVKVKTVSFRHFSLLYHCILFFTKVKYKFQENKTFEGLNIAFIHTFLRKLAKTIICYYTFLQKLLCYKCYTRTLYYQGHFCTLQVQKNYWNWFFCLHITVIHFQQEKNCNN